MISNFVLPLWKKLEAGIKRRIRGREAVVPTLPEELYYEILLRLPVKSALACKCVCKTWYRLISKPHFVKSHLNLTQNNSPSLMCLSISNPVYSITSYDSLLLSSASKNETCDIAVKMDHPFPSLEIDLLSSCHGLLLVSFCTQSCEGFICLWNPATSEYKKIPQSPNEVFLDQIGIWGFGYDYKIDDYKVFKTVSDYKETSTSLVSVYTLGSDSWKSIQTIPYRFSKFSRLTAGVLVNGSLHWVGMNGGTFYIIVSLNVSNDRFEEMKLPKEALENGHQLMNLEVLEGYLCVFTWVEMGDFEVWVMQDYGVQESWTKRYVITHECFVFEYCSRMRWFSLMVRFL